MNRRMLVCGLATLVAFGGSLVATTDVNAGGKRVAVVPAVVQKGNAGNSGPVTAAMAKSLKAAGYSPISAAQLEAAMKKTGFNPKQLPTTRTLGALRTAANVDLVVFTRVLSVGIGVNTREYQANILVNVQGKSASSFAYTRQVGHVFRAQVEEPEQAVLSGEDAEAAVKSLMGRFYKP